MNSYVLQWAAWAAGLERQEDWLAWFDAPTPIPNGPTADGAHIPAMLRRRCTPLSRIMLTAATSCLAGHGGPQPRTVFASRHGSVNESVKMLERLAACQQLSPTMFAHTVHNAQTALFSIATRNRAASSALAAEDDTFAAGYLEALTHLEREPGRPVLFVIGDVPLATEFRGLVEDDAPPYAVALLLSAIGTGSSVHTGVRFRISPSEEARETAGAWPDAIAFLRWLNNADAATFALVGMRHDWVWSRLSSASSDQTAVDR